MGHWAPGHQTFATIARMQNAFRFAQLLHRYLQRGTRHQEHIDAGDDCAIPAIGRYFGHGVIRGGLSFGSVNASPKDQETTFAQSTMSVVCQ